MFGISFWELGLVALVVLIVFGPEKLPELMSKIGKISGTTRKTADQFRKEFYNSVYTPAEEIKRSINNELRAVSSDAKTEKAKVAGDKPDPVAVGQTVKSRATEQETPLAESVASDPETTGVSDQAKTDSAKNE